MKIGLGIGEIALGQLEGMQVGLPSLIAEAKRAERDGFSSVWVANINGFDALTALAVLGRETEKIELGTGVVPTFPRHPFAMAQQAMSTQAAAGNRLLLGIGLSHKIVIENMLGLSWDKPFSHMREYLAVLAPLIQKGRVEFRGQEYKVNTVLKVNGAEPCPILVAALAPKMLALAGQVADGTVTWMTGPKTVRDHVVPRITQAASEAGRPKPRVVVLLPVAVTDDVDAARQSAAKRYAVYGSLPSYRAMLDREGAKGPDDVAIVGDEATVRQKLDELRQVGATDFVATPFPVGNDSTASVERTRSALIAYMKR
jgi:5,10-methylenetetrahydromethanopterin reductase